MLSRENRLPATTKLTRANYTKSELFAVKYASNGMTVSRFAFVVRKSVDKRAVIRNRIRRVFRSCVEELHKDIVPAYDMIFFLEKGIIDKQQADLCNDLRIFLQQKHMIA